MIRLFACDLDGTLLNERHESDAFIEGVLRSVVESGRYFTVRWTNHVYDRFWRNEWADLCDLHERVTNPGSKGRVVRCEDRGEVLRQLLEQFRHCAWVRRTTFLHPSGQRDICGR
ncbi:MAG: HAD family hydrolase [Merdibacter sp.]